MRNEATPALRDVSAANKPFGRSSRSGRAVWYSKPPLGRAEQRSSVRIKTLALFERSEFASVPNAASSARNPKGTDVARLFFGYFFLATQKKVTRPPGRDPASHRSEKKQATQTPSLLTKARHAVPLRPHSYDLTPNSYDLTPHSYDLTPHSYDLTPHSYDLTPHPYDLTPHSYDLTPNSYDLTPTTSPLRPHSSPPAPMSPSNIAAPNNPSRLHCLHRIPFCTVMVWPSI